MYAATKKVIMFVHLWKIFCEERSVFSILRKKKRGKFSHFYLLFFFFLNQTAGKQRGKAQESSGKIHCHQGSLCSSRNLWIEPLNSLSTMCVLKKQDTKRRRWFGSCGSPLPNGRKEMFGRNPKTEKNKKTTKKNSEITKINGWIVFRTQIDRFERERDHVWWQLVSSCDAPLADQWDLGMLVGWLSLLGHAWLDNGQRHSHTPLWES